MESKQDVDALGKNRDKNAEDKDFAKKQSDAQPAAENLDMMPYSVNKDGTTEFEASAEEKTDDYAKSERKKADGWEDHSVRKEKK